MYPRMVGPLSSGAAAGSDGEATANASTNNPISGRVAAVYVQYVGDPPAGTTDVVVKTTGTSPAPPSVTILSLTDGATGGWFYPRAAVHSTAGAALTLEGSEPVTDMIPIHDYINVLIDDANAGDSVNVWLMVC